MFRHFPGSLIQSRLDLKALNRNKPGRHCISDAGISRWFCFPFAWFSLQLWHNRNRIWIPGKLKWCLCVHVSLWGRKKKRNVCAEESWNSLKLHCTVSGKTGLWCKWRYSWKGEIKAECLYWFFSSVFLHQKINMWPPLNFCEQSMEDWAVQSVMCSRSRTRQSPRMWLSVKGTGIYSWPGVLGRKEPEGSGDSQEEKTCRVCAQCTSDHKKSFVL